MIAEHRPLPTAVRVEGVLRRATPFVVAAALAAALGATSVAFARPAPDAESASSGAARSSAARSVRSRTAAASVPSASAGPPAAPAPNTDAKSAATPATAAPATSAPVESLGGVGLKLLFGALLIAGVLYGAARLLRRLPIARLLPGADGPIKVIGRSHLGPKGSLCLVEVGRTTLLLGVTAGAIQTLHAWGESAEAASAATRTAVPVPGQLRGLENRVTGRTV